MTVSSFSRFLQRGNQTLWERYLSVHEIGQWWILCPYYVFSPTLSVHKPGWSHCILRSTPESGFLHKPQRALPILMHHQKLYQKQILSFQSVISHNPMLLRTVDGFHLLTHVLWEVSLSLPPWQSNSTQTIQYVRSYEIFTYLIVVVWEESFWV